jgi:hypothetical protein
MSSVLRVIPIVNAFVPPEKPKRIELPPPVERKPVQPIKPQQAPPSADPRAATEKLEADAASAAADASEAARRKRGRRASILTSPLGASQSPTNVRRASLGSI